MNHFNDILELLVAENFLLKSQTAQDKELLEESVKFLKQYVATDPDNREDIEDHILKVKQVGIKKFSILAINKCCCKVALIFSYLEKIKDKT